MWQDSSRLQFLTRWPIPTSVIWRQCDRSISFSNGQPSPNSAIAISPKFCQDGHIFRLKGKLHEERAREGNDKNIESRNCFDQVD